MRISLLAASLARSAIVLGFLFSVQLSFAETVSNSSPLEKPAEKVTEWVAKITPSFAEKESIEGFSLSDREVPVRLERKNNETFLWARVRGELSKSGWNLLYNNRWLVRSDGARGFEVEVRLMDETTTVSMSGFDSDGKFAEQRLDLEFPSWINFQAQIAEERKHIQEEKEKRETEIAESERRKEIDARIGARYDENFAKRVAKMKRVYFAPMVGYSFITYVETYQPEIDLMAVTPQVSLQVVVLPPWLSVQLAGHITAFSVSNSTPTVSTRFLGSDLTLGMSIPFGRSRLRLNLLAGVYYKTMIVSPPQLGYQNLIGPELFPILDYTLKGGHSISLFSKLSPAIGTDGFLPLEDREIVIGAGYTHQLQKAGQIPVQIEYSMIDLHLSSKYLSGRNFQISVGYIF